MENISDQPVLINHNLDMSVSILSVATVASFEFKFKFVLHLNVYCVNKYFFFLIASLLLQI